MHASTYVRMHAWLYADTVVVLCDAGEVAKHLATREEVLRKWETKLERRQRALDTKNEDHEKWYVSAEGFL